MAEAFIAFVTSLSYNMYVFYAYVNNVFALFRTRNESNNFCYYIVRTILPRILSLHFQPDNTDIPMNGCFITY